jgi:pimeloyl-ACP methyl ester carboxylesterase
MGSKLRDKNSGNMVWVDFSTIPPNPLAWGGWVEGLLRDLAYPNDDLEATAILDEVIFVPPWAKQEHYGRLLNALEQMGYKVNPARYPEAERNVYTFPYDWRQDNRRSAQLLAQAVEHWSSFHAGAQAWVIAHSNGGLVARWYIEKLGGKDKVGRLLLFGSPWDGTPKIMSMLFNGLDTLFRQRFSLFDIPRRSRDLIRTFPSAYQLIPLQTPFLHDANHQVLNPFEVMNWLDNEQQRALALDGQRFTQELGNTSSVETLCFFGRERPTTTGGVVRQGAQALWSDIDWAETDAGDGTIPERSAVHPHARGKYPFAASHGDIYVNPAALEFLKWELCDQYSVVAKGLLEVDGLTVSFQPTRDVFAPGEAIPLTASVQRSAVPSATVAIPATVNDAQIAVMLHWYQPLPGNPAPVSLPTDVGQVVLQPVEGAPGRYQGQMIAPLDEGYYHLRAQCTAAGQTVVLDETIAIEAVG